MRALGPDQVCLVLVFLAAAVVSSAAAQNRPRVWLGAGVGGGGTSKAGGAAVMAQVVVQKKAHYFAARGLYLLDIYSDNSAGEVGLLYGRAAKRDWGHASVAAGVALTAVTPCDTPSAGRCTTLGIPIVAEAALRFAPVIGFGLQGFTNLNTQAVYGGFILFVQLGWIP